MIPFVAVISLRNQESRTFRLWIPLFLMWLLLVPLGVLLSPFIFIHLHVGKVEFSTEAIKGRL